MTSEEWLVFAPVVSRWKSAAKPSLGGFREAFLDQRFERWVNARTNPLARFSVLIQVA